jgi:hypothetical protein
MNFPRCLSRLLLLPASGLLAVSCISTDALEHRVDRRTDNYNTRQERREIRQDARDARHDAWFDRIMD